MTIEASQYISGLNVAFPRSTDLLKEGDDHIRLIKSNLKNTFPNISKSVNATDDTLNFLNEAITASAAGVTFKKPITFAQNTVLNAGNNRVINVANPSATADAANMAWVYKMFIALYPIGALYISLNGTNPETFPMFQGTHWELYAQGCALVGTGNNHGVNLAAGVFTGEATHTLSVGEIPGHQHGLGGHTHGFVTNRDGNHTHTYVESWPEPTSGTSLHSAPAGPYILQRSSLTTGDGSHQHSGTTGGPSGPSDWAGGGGAHNNMQPSIGVNVWRRMS